MYIFCFISVKKQCTWTQTRQEVEEVGEWRHELSEVLEGRNVQGLLIALALIEMIVLNVEMLVVR
eukprot:SAG11_NODE_2990_length_2786_cov_4.823570_4_plen_65_part_00